MKNAVWKVRSSRPMKHAPTSTGTASTCRNDTVNMDQTNIGSLLQRMPGAR